MSEKSTFSKPFSAAIGKATEVFSRPKLQRRAFTAHAASELISVANLSGVLLDLKENGKNTKGKESEEEKPEVIDESLKMLTVLSHRLSTWKEDGAGIVDPISKAEENPHGPRRKSETAVANHNNKSTVSKDKNSISINCLRVKEIISEVLKAQLRNMEYNHRECGEKCRIISQLIEKRVKTLSTARYKVTAVVFIGAIRDKGIEQATQCTWSPGVDYLAMATFKNDIIFASGIAFATIFE